MTLANALTATRALLVIPVIGLIAVGDAPAALLVFIVAAATDAVDGPLARRRGTSTAFGAAMDPLADKILVVGALAALAVRGTAPVWAVALILASASVVLSSALTEGTGRFDASDLMPAAVGSGAEWTEMINLMKNGPSYEDTALNNIEAAWPKK